MEAYEAEGFPIWGLTPQNEPQTGLFDVIKWDKKENKENFIGSIMVSVFECDGELFLYLYNQVY